MEQTSKKRDPDLAPMSVGHGRKIYDQSRTITALVEKLHPLLALIEEEEMAPESDPISMIVRGLTEICKEQQAQREEQKSLHRKVDSIAARLGAAGPFTGFAK